jgi:phospholipid/cholesterol/gamma-HCH transport system substrate-binding protein
VNGATTRIRSAAAVLGVLAVTVTGCGWRGLNSLPLPGTQGHGRGAFTVQAQMPDVDTIQQNSRVRVGDVTVGTVTKIERQDWHALVTMRLNGDVHLPENVTATIGQTSLLGSLHIELAPAPGVAPTGSLHDGSLIPLIAGGSYPSTEQTLAAVSLLLNGGGIGQIQDITQAFSTALAGRDADLRSLITQADEFTRNVNDQTADIIAAIDAVNRLTGQLAARKPVLDKALTTIPAALKVLADHRDHLVEALTLLGKFSALAADSADQTKQSLSRIFNDLGPVLKSLADAGPALTRSLGVLTTYPWAKDTVDKWMRGDYANLTMVVDLTLSRIDSALFTGTRFEGDLTELELQWGRTIGQLPSPYTKANPLTVPYHLDQGP